MPSEVLEQNLPASDNSVTAYVAKKNQPLLINGAVKENSPFESSDKEGRVSSAMVVPMTIEGKLIGVLNVSRFRGGITFTQKHLRAFSILANQAAVAIELLRLNEAKIRAERLAAMGKTMAEIAHYVKNILVGIEGGVEIVNMGMDKQDWVITKKGWKLVRHNMSYISDLILDMLEYSGEKKLDKQEVNVNEIIHEVIELQQENIKSKEIQLDVKLFPHPIKAYLDRRAIHRCLLNLISNAIDAVGKRGRIAVTSSLNEEKNMVELKVADNGTGIPQDSLTRVFEPFFTTKSGKGTGLGLAITKKLIEAHDGSITVNSSLRKGTTFQISIPVKG